MPITPKTLSPLDPTPLVVTSQYELFTVDPPVPKPIEPLKVPGLATFDPMEYEFVSVSPPVIPINPPPKPPALLILILPEA
ncbi:MAG: hypothetical protein WC422_00465 [Candidatus Paceibacterota bacterium]